MKKIFVLLLFCFQTQLTNAQTLPSLLYANPAGTAAYLEEGRVLFTDQYGNTYAGGTFGGADFDPSPLVNYLPSANGTGDIFVVKYNKIGQYIWGISIGGSGYDDCFGITGDSLGNIYVTGLFSGTGDFDPGAGTSMLSSNGNEDVFIAKYNTNGQYQWAFNIGDVNDDKALTIKTDSLNNVYVMGTYEGVVDFDPSSTSFTLNSVSNTDNTFLAKYNTNGQFQWAFSLDVHCGWRSLVCDRSGNCYLIVRYGNSIDLDPSPAVAQFTNSAVSVALAKYNSSGQYIWAKDYNLNGGDLNTTSLSMDAQNNIYVTGLLMGVVDMNFSSSVNSLNTIGLNDIYLGKYDKDGNYLLSFNLGWPSTAHWGIDVAVDNLSNIYIVGCMQGVVDFDPSVATATFVPPGGQDGFIAKYNSAGQYKWAFAIGGSPYSDITSAVTVDGDGSVMTTGYFQNNNVDFDPGPAIVSVPNFGADFFIAKYGACIVPSTPSNLTTSNLFCSGTAATLSVTNSGNIYWYNSPVSTTSVGFGSNFSPTLTTGSSPTTYTFYAEAKTCTTSPQRAVVIVTVIPSPTVSASVSSSQVCAGNSVTLSGSGNGDTFNWVSFGPGLTQTITPVATTSFVFISTNTLTGCSSSVSVTPTVNALPLIIVNSGTICAGKSFTINPSGAITYTYSSGTNIVSPSNTTSYSVTGTSAAGCISGTAAIVNILVNPTPTILASNGTICSGQSFTINPSGANTYTYSSGTNIVTPATIMSYTITGSSTAGCLSAAPVIVTVSVNPTPTINVNNGVVCAGNSFTINPSGANTFTISGGNAVVTPTVTSSYSITGTSTAGCISAMPAIINVSVNPNPIISVNSGSICFGSPFIINPTGAITYTISGGNAIVSPASTSSYSVTGTDANGCITPNPAVSNVTVNSLPFINIASNNSIICTGQSATLTVGGANTYTWSNLSPGNTLVVSPAINTTYTVNGTDANGCNNFAVITQSVSLCTGIVMSSGVETQRIVIYPNPSKNSFNIECNCVGNNSAEIYNALGQLLFSQKITATKIVADLSDYPSGLYFLNVKSEAGEEVKRLIKE